MPTPYHHLATNPQEMGLAFDDWDLDYYTRLFVDMGRDPTNVELFDIAQSNSEHSRHWFFKGDLVIDGEKKEHNLMELVAAPLKVSAAHTAPWAPWAPQPRVHHIAVSGPPVPHPSSPWWCELPPPPLSCWLHTHLLWLCCPLLDIDDHKRPLRCLVPCHQAQPNNNSVVAFKDNSSAIRGFKVTPILPLNPGGPSALAPQARDWDLLLTAETHNFPCAVAPYPGEWV